MIRFPEQSGLQLFFPIVTMSKPCQTIYSYFLTYTEVFLFQHLGEEIAQAMNTGGLPHGAVLTSESPLSQAYTWVTLSPL